MWFSEYEGLKPRGADKVSRRNKKTRTFLEKFPNFATTSEPRDDDDGDYNVDR